MIAFDPREFEERFTKAIDAVRHIEELESLNLEAISIEELQARMAKYFRIIPFVSGRIAAGHRLYRARLNIGNQPFQNLNEVFVPPRHLIKSYGRANRPNEQIFYSASNMKLAAFEVLYSLRNAAPHSQHYTSATIGIWRVVKQLHVASIIHSPVLHSIRKDIAKAFKSHQDLMNRGDLQNNTVSSNNLICQFFSDQFTKDRIRSPHDYKISALYASMLQMANGDIAPRFRSERFDGINYPSVAARYRGDNQAIFMSSVLEKIQFETAIQISCDNIDVKKYDFEPIIQNEVVNRQNEALMWRRQFSSR